MNNLNISVADKIAKYLQRDGAIVCGNTDYQITFTFDTDWDTYENKTARFIWNGKYWDQIFSGNVCPVPKITGASNILVGVYAGDLSTTTPASIPCKRSILCDEVEKREEFVEEYRDEALEAAERAEAAAERAEAILAELDGTALLGRINENDDSNIILKGALPGTIYTMSHEKEDGSVIEIGTLDFSGNSGGGSSGDLGVQPQLYAPKSLSITKILGELTIVDDTNNGAFADGYAIYLNDVFLMNVTENYVVLTEYTGHNEDVTVKVCAIGENFRDSDFVSVLWKVPMITEGTIGLSYQAANGNDKYYCTGIGDAIETDIAIDSACVEIKDYAFRNAAITSVIIPDSVINIGRNAFQDCKSLASINIPDSVTNINGSTFYGCTSLTSINIPDSVTSIGDGAFYGCTSLTSIDIPDSVTNLEHQAFYGCTSLTSIVIPDSVTNLGGGVLRNCTSLTSVSLPKETTSIPDYLCYGCTALTSFEFPEGVTAIENSALGGCGFTSIEIPDSVEFLGGFNGSSVLTHIKVGSGVKTIERSAFYYSTALISVDFSAAKAVPTLESYTAFLNTNVNCKIYVPTALYDEWKSATNWSTWASRIVAV